MGRLDDIIERNRNPRRAIRNSKNRRGLGLAGVVLFVALILLIFTDLAKSPDAPPDAGSGSAQPGAAQDRVRGVRLRPPPAGKPGSGSAAVVPVDAGSPASR